MATYSESPLERHFPSQHLHSVPPREPDHEFDAYLRVAGRPEQLCDCLIWLPKDASEDAQVEITVPMSPDPPIYFGPGPLTFVGREGRREITLSGVWLKSGPAHPSPPRLAGRSRVELFQIDHIVERTDFKEAGDSANRFPEELSFALTDCPYLRPAISTELDRSGGEKVTVVGQLTVQYCPLGMIKFERRYTRYRREDVPGTVTTFALVASITDPAPAMIEKMEVTQENMEDACLLASLGARHRVMVIRVDSAVHDTFCQKWIDPLRRPRPEPQNDRFTEGLIPQLEFEHFFRMAGNEFYRASLADRKRIRDVIYILAPMFDLGGEEPAFLSAFSALEGLSRFGKR